MTNTNQTITTATGHVIAINRDHQTLVPRAQAVLCALRKAPSGSAFLADAIGDVRRNDTESLIGNLVEMGLVALTGRSCTLTYDGIGWVESNGMTVAAPVKEIASQIASQRQALS